MKTTLLTLTTAALLGSAAGAQPAKPKGGDLPSLPVPNGALIRLYFPTGGPTAAFKITREGGGRTVTLNSPVPAPRDEALKNKFVDAKTYDLLTSVYVDGNASLNKDPIAKFSLDLQVAQRPDWARALGLIFKDSGLQNGARYTYRVTASVRGRDVEVGRATVTPGPTPALAAPRGLTVTPSGTRATLTWQPGSDDTIAYKIARAEGNANPTVLDPAPFFPSVPADGKPRPPTFRDDKLKPDARYRYTVSAIDLFGRESPRATPVAVDMLDGQALPEPSITSSDASDKVVRLRWAAVTDRRVTGLKVLRGTTPANLREIATLAASATAFEDRKGQGGTFYLYALAVVTKDGTADTGAPRREKFLNFTPPPAPTNVAVTLKDGVVRVTWTASKSDEVRGYVVLRSADRNAPAEQYEAMNGTPTTGTTLEQPLAGTPGASYAYRVQAVSTSDRRSAPSEVAVLTLPAVGPLITLEGADATPEAVTLKWRVGGGTPGGIELFRQNPDGTLALIARLPGTATTFVDRNIVMTRPYAYVAFALNDKGERVRPSNVVSTTVPLRIDLGSVTNLAATSGPGGVTVTWQRAKNAYTYLVYRVESGADTLVGSTRDARLVDPSGKSGVTYRVVPSAVNGTSGDPTETRAR